MEDIFLNPKEAKRVYLLEQLTQGKLTTAEAAEHLSLSPRHLLRLKAAFAQHGPAALAHKARGRPSPRATDPTHKAALLALAQSPYQGASLNHLAELLQRHHGIDLSAKTIGRILAQAGLRHPASKALPKGHKSRARKQQAGRLVQLDASLFDWLEGRGPQLCLHGAIDDATSRVLGLYFRRTEDTHGYLQVLWQLLTAQGLPTSVYSDRHTLFFSPKKDKLSISEQLEGKQVALTQIGRTLEALGIGHIPANSPQAKGRIERLWQTLQQRLVIEMRIAGIDTLEATNAFLPGFLPDFNARFSVCAPDPTPAFRPAPSQPELARIVCLRHERKATRGSSISFAGCLYQLQDVSGKVLALMPGKSVFVLEHLNGSRSALYQDQDYQLVALPLCPSQSKEQAVVASCPPSLPAPPVKPKEDHPWKRPWSPRQAQATKLQG